MMCFRDRNFCSQSEECANKKCPDNFNKLQQESARAWMGANAPVAFTDLKTKECGFKEVK